MICVKEPPELSYSTTPPGESHPRKYCKSIVSTKATQVQKLKTETWFKKKYKFIDLNYDWKICKGKWLKMPKKLNST